MSDGSSDKALIPLLTWCLRRGGVQGVIEAAWADLRRLRNPPRDLVGKIIRSLQLYPCELIFVHRDAEAYTLEQRRAEITAALAAAAAGQELQPTVRVVPVRMMEAWLLCHEDAIRGAAGNPNGRAPLQLPPIAEVEGIHNPKEFLDRLLREASGLNARRRRLLPTSRLIHRIPELTDDFRSLDVLPSFAAFTQELEAAIQDNPDFGA